MAQDWLREAEMRFATYRGNGMRQIGIVDPGTAEIRPLALAPEQAEIGA